MDELRTLIVGTVVDVAAVVANNFLPKGHSSRENRLIDLINKSYGFFLANGFAPPTLGLSSVKESSALNGNWRTDC